jgi:hypothetical protein
MYNFYKCSLIMAFEAGMRNIYCYRQKNVFYEHIKVVYDYLLLTGNSHIRI